MASALEQTLPAAEIIVIDDGSTDDTAQVAASFGPRVKYIYQENAGLSAARNTGIANSIGDYIGFLDADDLWRPEFLATLAGALDSNPGWGAVYCGNHFIDERGKLLYQVVNKLAPPTVLHEILLDGQFFPPSAVLVRRTALERVGTFDQSLRAVEDWDMWLRISAKFPFGGVPQPLALYRMHGNNMTRDLARMQASMFQVLRKHFGDAEGEPQTWSNERQRAFAGVYFWLSLAHFQRNDHETGQHLVNRAFTTNPDLAKSIDTFYMLVCANQPPGYVGDLETLHLEQNEQNLFASLHSIFNDAAIPERLQANRQTAYSLANFALGLIAYRKRQLGKARRHLLAAAAAQPKLVSDARWHGPFWKSFVGNRLLDAWRKQRKPGGLGPVQAIAPR